ncbi:MAG: DUF192 domain-containing protein [Woeseiaceae bacterium]
MRYPGALLVLLLASLPIANAIADDDLDAAFDKDVLIIHASEHACYRIDIYIAETAEQRQRGLMHVRSLPETTGMLFIYPAEQFLSIWMKNTFIPLDILFVKADGQVSSIYYDAEPQSERSMRSLEPVQYVLELNAGVAETLSIDQYSQLEWQRD